MSQSQSSESINTWVQSMERQMESQREALRARDPVQVAFDSGAQWEKAADGGGTLSLSILDNPLTIAVPDYKVFSAEGSEAPTITQGLIIAYLVTARGIARTGNWVAFRELPNGLFYHQAFDGYTSNPLVRVIGDNLESFKRGAKSAGGHMLTGFGDKAFEFQVLPRIWLAVAYWLGDQEDGFPPRAKVLFDRAASSYLITDGLAILGSQLVRRIMRDAQK